MIIKFHISLNISTHKKKVKRVRSGHSIIKPPIFKIRPITREITFSGVCDMKGIIHPKNDLLLQRMWVEKKKNKVKCALSIILHDRMQHHFEKVGDS